MGVIDSVNYSAIFPARNGHESTAIIVTLFNCCLKPLVKFLMVVKSEIDSTFKLNHESVDSKVPARFIINPDPGVFGGAKIGVHRAIIP